MSTLINRSKFARLAILLLTLSSLGACASGGSKPVNSQTVCSETRAQVCTMDYTPVCAELKNGELKTYSNACTACAEVNVVSHRAAACE